MLDVERVDRIESFSAYECFLEQSGPWIGGFDHPFGQPIPLLDRLALPHRWADYVPAIERWGRDGFAARVKALQAAQPPGAKEWHRVGDALAGASAPHKTVNPPVGWMFVEGAPRLLKAGVTVRPLHEGDSDRIALEAYPALIARRFAGGYKTDTMSKHTAAHIAGRRAILAGLSSARMKSDFGFSVRLPPALAPKALDDPSGDTLDAILCAAQAGWAWTMRVNRRAPFGIPNRHHPTIRTEGWIVDPCLLGSSRPSR